MHGAELPLRVPLDERAPPEPIPLSDLGRELEVLLYGSLGGFAAKLKSMRSEVIERRYCTEHSLSERIELNEILEDNDPSRSEITIEAALVV